MYDEIARRRAEKIAVKYLGDCAEWSDQRLIGQLEQTAYDLARGDKRGEANALFIAVADMELSRSRMALS